MQPSKLLQDFRILGPFALAVSAGLVVLFRCRRQARAAVAFGALGLVGLTARAAYNYYGGVPVARSLQAQVGDPSLASLLLQSMDGLLVGMGALLLVVGVVTDRGERPHVPPLSGSGDDA